MISGSRTATTGEDAKRLTAEIEKLQPTHILTGGAIGADEIAKNWAKQNNCPTTIIKPDYQRHGKAATHQRNDELIKQADSVLCYYATTDGSKTAGTASVAHKAAKQKKLIAEIYRAIPTVQQISLF